MTPKQDKALIDFLVEMNGYTLYDLGPRLTCAEADSWLNLLIAFGQREHAASLLDGHVGGDDDNSDYHYGWTTEDMEKYLDELEEDSKVAPVSHDEVIAGLQEIAEDLQ